MRFRWPEVERLEMARLTVSGISRSFGVNKSREIERLLYEISKREDVHPAEVLNHAGGRSFVCLKKYLVRRRFPIASSAKGKRHIRPYLPKLKFEPECALVQDDGSFAPRRIIMEEEARSSALARRLAAAFTGARQEVISGLRDYVRGDGCSDNAAYGRRRDTLIVVREQHDYCKPCPCTRRAVGCGYHIMNLGFGCIYECSYCYLQEYSNVPGIILPVNIDAFFDQFGEYKKGICSRSPMRIGTGEFSDSLMLDHLTEYSGPLVEFFSKRDDAIFEFKTKSANVENILSMPPAGNIVVSWSLNPVSVIRENELYSVPLDQRLNAAARVAEAGYGVGFHFDPMIFLDKWEAEYAGVIEMIFSKVKADSIAWISLGTLRFKRELKTVIENRFPRNAILDAELLPGVDGKLRYPRKLRTDMYGFMVKNIRRFDKRAPVYLCMEDKPMWDEVGMKCPVW